MPKFRLVPWSLSGAPPRGDYRGEEHETAEIWALRHHSERDLLGLARRPSYHARGAAEMPLHHLTFADARHRPLGA